MRLSYREGYAKALMDLAGWINKPNAPLDRRLCNPKRLSAVIGYIISRLDNFMDCPDLFSLNFTIIKNKLDIRG